MAAIVEGEVCLASLFPHHVQTFAERLGRNVFSSPLRGREQPSGIGSASCFHVRQECAQSLAEVKDSRFGIVQVFDAALAAGEVRAMQVQLVANAAVSILVLGNNG